MLHLIGIIDEKESIVLMEEINKKVAVQYTSCDNTVIGTGFSEYTNLYFISNIQTTNLLKKTNKKKTLYQDHVPLFRSVDFYIGLNLISDTSRFRCTIFSSTRCKSSYHKQWKLIL